jgi:hypothetical protein
MTDEEFRVNYEKGRIGDSRLREFFMLKLEGSPGKCEFLEELVQSSPEGAVWVSTLIIREGNYLADRQRELVSIGLNDAPHAARWLGPSIWGFYLNADDAASHRIRSVLIDQTRRWSDRFVRIAAAHRCLRHYPFPLHLPAERPLLLGVAAALIGPDALGQFSDERPDWNVVPSFVPDVADLTAVAVDEDAPVQLRLAAMVLELLHHGASRFAVLDHLVMIENAIREWPFTVFMIWMASVLKGVDEKPEFRQLFDRTIRAAPLEVSRNWYWHRLIRRWRERSSAPVTSADLLERWLDAGEEEGMRSAIM